MKSPENKPQNPPKWPLVLLKALIRDSFIEEIEGDMRERFDDNLRYFSFKEARRRYCWDTLKLLRPVLLKRPGGDYRLNFYGMLTNNIKIAWRQMLRHQVFTGIKIGGFAIGIAACILIALYVAQQTSYDQHYKDKERLFRLVNRWSGSGETGYWTNVHGPLKSVLEDNIPEIEKVARVVLWTWGDAGDNHIRKVEAQYNEYEEGFFYADPELLDILEVPMVYGSQEDALSVPSSIVISRSKADLYFPEQNPVGQRMILNDHEGSIYTIGGVMEDFPSNSHLKGDFIMTLYGRKHGPGTTGWCCTNYNIYTKLTAYADKSQVEKKTLSLRNTFILDKLREIEDSGLEDVEKYQSYYLQPVTDIYLNPEKVEDDLDHGSMELIKIFSFIAITILLIACINFVHLSTARSTKRRKEVGVRKVLGSFRSNLMYQYLAESCLYSVLSVVIALLLVGIILPFFNQLAGNDLVVPWFTVWFVPLMFALALFIGVLSGLYPAFYLSGLKPIDSLKGSKLSGKNASMLRSGMVIFQFATAVMLIIGALVSHQQFEFFMNKTLGYDKNQVVNIHGLDSMEEGKRMALKNELLKLSTIDNASLSDYLPVKGGRIQNRTYSLVHEKYAGNGFEAARWEIDAHYLQTMGMGIIEGRNFLPEGSNTNDIIINEKMAHALGLKEPIGTQVVDMFDEKHSIIGIVNDFHFESLLGEVRPLVMVYGSGKQTLSVKIDAEDIGATMASITGVWDEFNQSQTIRYSFMDHRFAMMYDAIKKAKTIFLLFAILSIVVACLGLFALSMHMAEQRQKEVSIRKTLGATSGIIFKLLTLDFVTLIFIAILIATPLAWLVLDELLNEIASRIELSWHIFSIAGLLVIVIALVTISIESLKAATANPAERLRSE